MRKQYDANGTKINVDVESIARGIFDIMDEDQRACRAFGLLPAPVMAVLEKTTGQKFDEIREAQWRATWEDETGEIVDFVRRQWDAETPTLRRQFVQAVMHDVTVALYSVAPIVV